MDGLVERAFCGAAAAHGRNQTDRACERGGFVAQNIAEEIGGDDHVELRGIQDDLHRGVVHVQVIEFDIRIIFRHARDGFAPKDRRRQHIGFVHAGDALAARLRSLESVTGYALDFGFGILSYVAGAFDAVVAAAFVRAEINIAGELAHDFEINPAGALGPQRRNSNQRFADADRPEIDVEIEAAPQCQQTAFRALAERLFVPLGAAYRAEQNCICRFAARKRVCW